MCVQSQRQYFGERHHIVVTDRIAELLNRLGRDKGVSEKNTSSAYRVTPTKTPLQRLPVITGD